jgi:hypothetical protein
LPIYLRTYQWNNYEPNDGLVWSGASSSGGTVCFRGSNVMPPRHGEYRFAVGVTPTGTGQFSPYWPYWIGAKK